MRKKTILLVEDNPDDEALVLMSLKKLGADSGLVVAHDGQEALDYLFGSGPHSGRDPQDLPTIVFLDLKLPKVDGLEVLQRVRAAPATRLQPVVILTSSDEERDRLKSYDLGVNSYVCKPVDFLAFKEAVDCLGRYWLTCNQHPKG